MINKCIVKIVSNKVICDNSFELNKLEKEKKEELYNIINNKKKLNHLESIGMKLDEYHPSIIRIMIDGGRNILKIPESLKNQLIKFTNEAHVKGFNPSVFGYNTTLHKFIKTIHKIPTRKYLKKGGEIKPIKSNISFNIKEESENEIQSDTETESDTESENELDNILKEIEEDLINHNIKEVKRKLKKYKSQIPKEYYTRILKTL